MQWIHRLYRRFLILFRKEKVEREMEREMRLHIERDVEENLRDGMSPDEARRAAMVSFGGVERFKEQSRDERGGRLLDDLVHDVRFAVRTLRKRPRFAILAIATLGLGIGATTAVFSALDAVLLRPLPFHEPERLMRVSLLMPESVGLTDAGTRRQMVWSYPKYRIFRESQDIFESTATYFRREYSLTDVDQPERIPAEVVSSGYFSVLGIEAELGRAFVPGSDDTPGAGPEMVVSHGLWAQKFGSDPGILGRTIHLNGTAYMVVGVMPPGTGGLRGAPEIWVPNNTIDPRILASNAHQFHVVARLRPAFTYQQAVSVMDALGRQIDEAYPDPGGVGTWSATAHPLDEYRVGSTVRTSVLLLFTGAGLVLLTACVNVAGLVLALSESRRRELGTRLALGSGRRRLVRQLLTESLILSTAGGALGIAIAVAGVKYFNSLGAATRFEMSGLERTAFNSISIDSATLTFCLVVVCLAPLLVGLWPARSSSRIPLVSVLKGGGTERRPHRGLARSVLVTAQIALAFTLLVGSGLLVTTMKRLHATDLGFWSENVLSVRVALPGSQYDPETQRTFFSQLVERGGALPGIHAASFVDCVPLADGCRNTSRVQARDGISVDSNAEPIVGVTRVSPEFFSSLNIPVTRGRSFTDLDRKAAPRVAVLSQEAASRFWPGEDPVGRTLSIRGFEGATVVGVVGDVRFETIEDSPRPNIYVPSMQASWGEGFLVVRVSGAAATYVPAIREVVRDLDPDLPVFDVRTMSDRVADATWRTRFSTMVISLFAAMTFALSAIGVYGAFSHSVETTTRSIGVRIALGATRARVLKGVLRRAALLAIAGITPGILLASVSTGFIETLLFETSPHDPTTFAVISVVFLAIALLASFFPARKASGVDPAAVLRNE